MTAIATGLLVLVGGMQVMVLVAQQRQHHLDLVNSYSRRWTKSQTQWATLVYVGRRPGEFYQVADSELLRQLVVATVRYTHDEPSTWAHDAARAVTTLLSDVCLRILQGQLTVRDIYPVFGTELLRHGSPLRALLDVTYLQRGDWSSGNAERDELHGRVRSSVQEWLIYHDGMRRRCLILVDLLWAEAARLEDLAPSDLRDGAEAKQVSGDRNRKRVHEECLRLRGRSGTYRAWRLSRFLRHGEYRRPHGRIGLKVDRIERLQEEWERRLLYGAENGA